MKPLTVSAVATRTGLSVQRIRQLIHSGELPAFCPGGSRWMVEPADLEKFIADRRNNTAPVTASEPEVK